MDFKQIAQDELKKIKKEKTTSFTLNLVGIRDEFKVNTFNDTLVYWYYNEDKELHITQVDRFTTDPGLSPLHTPENPKGCAILCTGYYEKMWTKGKHKGKYDALVQCAPCKVYRDSDKDDVLTFVSKSLDNGVFGINLHRANETVESTVVGGFSAGCQVFANPVSFQTFMETVDLCIKKSEQKYFDYLLLNKRTDLKL
jgi:hypothetical protein